MGFEDAETLAYTLARVYFPPPAEDPHTHALPLTLPELLTKWCAHRQARVQNVHDFTTRNGEFMHSSPSFYEQAAKAWVIWASIKLRGSAMGAQWLYQYKGEEVLAAIAK